MPLDIALIRTTHIVAAALWTGMAFYHVTIVVPVLRADPDLGGKFMRQVLLQGKLSRAFLTLGILTVAAGLALYARIKAYEADMGSTYGVLLNLGVLCGILALGIGLFVSYPTTRKLKALMSKPGPPDMVKVGPLAKKLGMAAQGVVGLLMVAILCMALATRL